MELKIQISGSRGKTGNYDHAVRSLGALPRSGYCPPPDLSCDGLILCGGGDLDSLLYDQKNAGSAPPDPARDKAEMELFHAFFQAGKPILGICRGMQVINVALGGTLIQDLPPHIAPAHGGGDHDLVHPVLTEADTFLREHYGPRLSVNSAHHQAVDRLGDGLRTAARAEDGVIEALFLPCRPVLGVQFHPERMAFSCRREDTADGALVFSHFINMCLRASSR